MIWRGTAREVAEAAEVVFSMVTDDAALNAVTCGPDGVLAGLASGKVYVDMSTVSPQASRRLAEHVSERGAKMLDAPVSGSIPQAETGALAIMVGGERQAFAAAEPLLRELGQTVTHIGPNGQGLLLKLRQHRGEHRRVPRSPARTDVLRRLRREGVVGREIIVGGQTELLQVVDALSPTRGFACGLNRG